MHETTFYFYFLFFNGIVHDDTTRAQSPSQTACSSVPTIKILFAKYAISITVTAEMFSILDDKGEVSLKSVSEKLRDHKERETGSML